jgi:GT2 family glycosyltransferase
MPRVLIVVLNYNGRDCLLDCLNSLRVTLVQGADVLVVDNASTDDSFQRAKNQFPEYRFLTRLENGGFAAGMNEGLHIGIAEKYDFTWLMNSDATVEVGTLPALLAAHKSYGACLMSPLILDSVGQEWFAGGRVNFWRMRVEHTARQTEGSIPYKTDFLTGCALFLHRSAVQKVGLLDERFFLYYEDADFSWRAREKKVDLFVVPTARVIHQEKSSENSQKWYFVVRSGLLFFALHTPVLFRPYLSVYVIIRRLVNFVKVWMGLPDAASVKQAYTDYFRTYGSKDKLYFRKLSQ